MRAEDASGRVQGSFTPQIINSPNVNSNEPHKLRPTICQILDPLDFRKVEVQGLIGQMTGSFLLGTKGQQEGKEPLKEGLGSRPTSPVPNAPTLAPSPLKLSTR